MADTFRSRVMMRNVTVKVFTSSGALLWEGRSIPGNMQRDKRPNLGQLLQGLEIDITNCYRVRLDLMPDGMTYRAGIKVLVVGFPPRRPQIPQLLGWWECWCDADIDAGSLPTALLYVKRSTPL